MPDDLYSIERANAALPLVKSIASDLVAVERQIAQATRAYSRLKRLPEKPQFELNTAQRALADLLSQRDACTEELTEIGVRLGDAAKGVCDFPAEIDGERVYLCWALGEERVDFYHALDAGFAGRSAIPVPAGVS